MRRPISGYVNLPLDPVPKYGVYSIKWKGEFDGSINHR